MRIHKDQIFVSEAVACIRLTIISVLMISIGACTTETDNTDTQTNETVAQDEQLTTGENNEESSSTQPGGSGGSGGSDAGSGASGSGSGTVAPVILSDILPGLFVTDYVVVTTRRTGRTTMEYELKLKISNASSTVYENVMASLLSAPAHIAIVDSVAVVGDVPANATILSDDSFTIDVDLAMNTSFDDLVWRIEGDVVPPPPPPPSGSGPSETGFFMSIDDNHIPGEASSSSHKDWIELDAIMEGLHREGSATGSTRRRSAFVFDGVQVEKKLDRSSPKLREALVGGTIFGEVKIDIIQSCDGLPYTAYAITLSTTRLDGLNLHGEEGDRPSEELSFNYTRIESMYTPVADDCSLLPPVFSTQDGKLLEL